MTRRIVAISAGLSQPSSSRLLTDRLVESSTRALGERGEQVEVTVVELREYARDLADHLVTGFPAPRLATVIEQVTAADALVVVTPIFSASYSGLFKTFFDVLDPTSLSGTPVLLGATGGTARHSLALEHAVRPLFSYLRTVTVPTAVFAAPEDWASDGLLADRIRQAGDELAGLLTAGAAPVTAAAGDQAGPTQGAPIQIGTVQRPRTARAVDAAAGAAAGVVPFRTTAESRSSWLSTPRCRCTTSPSGNASWPWSTTGSPASPRTSWPGR